MKRFEEIKTCTDVKIDYQTKSKFVDEGIEMDIKYF